MMEFDKLQCDIKHVKTECNVKLQYWRMCVHVYFLLFALFSHDTVLIEQNKILDEQAGIQPLYSSIWWHMPFLKLFWFTCIFLYNLRHIKTYQYQRFCFIIATQLLWILYHHI